MTHAIIIGGGIAGPVTGLALQRAGVSSTVYEAHTGRDDAGGWLTIAVNGLAALRSLDLHGPMAAGFRRRRSASSAARASRSARCHSVGCSRTGR